MVTPSIFLSIQLIMAETADFKRNLVVRSAVRTAVCRAAGDRWLSCEKDSEPQMARNARKVVMHFGAYLWVLRVLCGR